MSVVVWFVVPAHGRAELASICFRQLARTCDELADMGVDAYAIVVADDENLETARAAGLEALEAPNQPLGRKWNDGYEFAGRAGADFVVPFGSDDWIDPRLIARQVERDGEIRCSRTSSVVREDGRMLARLRIPYNGGDGVRVIPTWLIEPFGYRPCDDAAPRAIDTTTMRRLEQLLGRPPELSYLDLHPLQIVDFKSGDGGQLNGYAPCLAYRDGDELRDPWPLLAEHYPADVVADMQALYRIDGALPARPTEQLPEPETVDVAIDVESLTFPRELLAQCSSALLLFASGRMGAADGLWVRQAGLHDVTAVDWDAATLDPFAKVYPACWNYVQADVFEWVKTAGRRWDIVSADAPSQCADRLAEMLPRYCELAERFVAATMAVTGDAEPVVPAAPEGWCYREEPLYRAEFEGRRFWWLVLERLPVLAFDDGPADTTGPILDVLAAHGARACFFVNGSKIAGREETLRRIVAEGHEIGNHGWSHTPMDEMSGPELADEVERTHRAIVAVTNATPRRLRPPFVRFPDGVTSICGYDVIEREPSFGDYDLTTTEIIDEALARIEGRLWLHDEHWPTVEALPAILAAMA